LTKAETSLIKFDQNLQCIRIFLDFYCVLISVFLKKFLAFVITTYKKMTPHKFFTSYKFSFSSRSLVGFLRCQFFAIMILLTATACSMSFFQRENQPLEVPTSVPIDVTKKGNKTEVLVKLRKECGCGAYLDFYYIEHDMVDRERVDKIVGHSKRGSGVKTPVHLTFTKIEKDGREIILLDEEKEPKIYSWGGFSFSKRIDGMLFLPGLYKISIEALKDSPELKEVKMKLSIGRGRGKV